MRERRRYEDEEDDFSARRDHDYDDEDADEEDADEEDADEDDADELENGDQAGENTEDGADEENYD